MGTVTLAGKTIEVDEDGFLADRSVWSEEIAKELAKVDNCELTPEHWEVINFQREYHEQFQASPDARMLPRMIGKKLGADKGDNKYLYKLFPHGGPLKQSCKYAGLPKPTGCT